ncbi:7-deoxyloganetic acid glucosyl transferase-like [Henckelia pumila]|uniref:7-deoxyloganetic acid glucosyl transferase-like n=1 Tax=Henckelia pumila TaxID=405737 RepID=UPI003C6E8D83
MCLTRLRLIRAIYINVDCNKTLINILLKMCSKEAAKVVLPPHVLIFPLPAQGHMNSMLNLAQLFCLSHFHVTFIVSEFNHSRLMKHSGTRSTFERYPGFRFQTIPDGLPDDHPRAGYRIMDIIPSLINDVAPYFKKMLIHNGLFASANRRPVTCIIADGVLSFAADFAEERRIPLIFFRTVSACAFWTLFYISQVAGANEMPIQENRMVEIAKTVPGMEGLLRRCDVPRFCGVDDTSDPSLWEVISLTSQTVRANAFILNTFDDLEQPVLSKIVKHIPRLYTIGPGSAHLKSRLGENKVDTSTPSASLWAEDLNCIEWLDAQKPKSVIYVSFGSITTVTREQLLEFWHGLVNSKRRFLWVMRPDSIMGKDGDQIPAELEKGTKENGYMVEWAPQEEVLNHSAVGGFLTHGGWNSTLESIVAGVPMICWSYFADQMVNSRFVSHVWKIGLDVKDSCDRVVIENAVKELMEVRKDEFLERASHLAKSAKTAINEGGSSYSNLNDLMEYIESFIV